MTWVHVVVDLPGPLAGAGTRFWSAALGWPLGEAWSNHPEFRTFLPPAGDAYVLTQTLQQGEPRVHVDLEVADVAASAERLSLLGATNPRRGNGWQILRSPGGLPFCLIPADPHQSVPPSTAWADGHRTRLVQVCIDAPADLLDREVEFWQAALTAVSGPAGQWTWRPSAEEFVGRLLPPTGCPVQFLFQRLGETDPGRTVRAHLDLGSDDREAEAQRLVGLGAERLWTGDGFVCLRDPVGLPFCVTGNPPD
jgi:hypothetical protein